MSPAPDVVLLVDHALAYAASGLEVFPLKPDKTPYTEHGMKEATRDPATITRWWSRWPSALIGARIPDDVVVLDVDVRHGGHDTLHALEGAHHALTPTRWHASGRGDGGRHLWFRRPPGKLSVKRLNDWARERGVGHQAGKRSWSAGIDVLHHGHRYTILPPSPHPDTGRPYTWGAEDEPAAMPPWLAWLVTIDPEPERPALRVVGDQESIADWYSSTTSWHDLLPRDGWQLVEGDGDADGSKWRHPNASAAHSATVKHGCLFVYSSNTDFPVTEDGDPNGVTRFRAWAILEHDGDLTAAARAAYVLRDGDLEPWRAELEAQARDQSNEPALTVSPDALLGLLINWNEFWTKDHQSEDWLIEPIIPRGRAVAIYAPGGTGKSLLSLYLAACAATGRPVLGRVKKPVSVLYIDYEMTQADVAERLDSMGFGLQDADALQANLHYALLPTIDPLDTRPGARTVVELAALVNAEFVVIDTFARAVCGDENEADTVREFYRHTGVALKAAGRAWARIDHSGKDLEKGARGTSAKRDDVDVVWQMTAQEGGVVTMKATKRRMAWVPEVVNLVLVEEEVLEFRLAESSRFVLPTGSGAVAELLDTLGVPLTASNRQAAATLREAGHKATNAVIRGAVKWRQEAARHTLESSARGSARAETVPPAQSCRSDGTPQELAGHSLGTPFGTRRHANSSQIGTVPPPKGGTAEGAPQGASFNLLTDWTGEEEIDPTEGAAR